jgi:polyisoprenoid-binding protein YceI
MKRCAIVLALVATAASAAPLHVQKFDLNHSTIAFRVPILGGMSEVEGKFLDFAIDLNYDEESAAKSGVTATIQTSSIDTGIADRDKHLKTADFFDVAKYPEIRFVSSQIEKTGDGFIAHGALTMRGVTKQIALPFKLAGARKDADKKTLILAFTAETHLNRRDYGINWTHPVDPLFVGDDVIVIIHLLTKKIPLE